MLQVVTKEEQASEHIEHQVKLKLTAFVGKHGVYKQGIFIGAFIGYLKLLRVYNGGVQMIVTTLQDNGKQYTKQNEIPRYLARQ